VGVLKACDQPLACLLGKDQGLNSFPGLGNAGRRLGPDHRPARVSERDLRRQKPHLHIGDREAAFTTSQFSVNSAA
jgi:hypothetical protein